MILKQYASRMKRNSENENTSFGYKLADNIASVVGSWKFVVVQSLIIFFWVIINILWLVYQWDPYPFVLLNLFLNFQAAYMAPIIMMSQNRMEEKDRIRSIKDYETNIKAEKEIEKIQKEIIEMQKKLDRILESRVS